MAWKQWSVTFLARALAVRRGAVMAIVVVTASLVTATPGFATVCFQVGTDAGEGYQLILDVTSMTPGGFFSLAGELVTVPSPGARAPLTGGGRLRADGTASFVLTTFLLDRFTMCCERFVTGVTAMLNPPDYSTGSATVVRSFNDLGFHPTFDFGEMTTGRPVSSMACP